MTSSNQVKLLVNVGGSTVVNKVIGTALPDNDYNVAVRVKLNDMGAILNGVAMVPDTSAALPVGMVTVRPGMDHNSGNQRGGTFARVRIFDSGLTDAQMQVLAPAP